MISARFGLVLVIALAGGCGEEEVVFAGGTQGALCTNSCAATELVGNYRIESRFELAARPPGKLGLIDTYIDVTDDPNDPATWLLDRVEDALPDRYRAALALARTWSPIDEQINAKLLSYAPAVVQRVIRIGDQLGQVVDTLGVQSYLAIDGDPVEPTAGLGRHQVTGARFWVDGVRHDFSAEELHWTGADVARDIPLRARPEGGLDIADHALELPYGDLLLFAAQNVILPLHDSQSRTFDELLGSFVDCDQIGAYLTEHIGEGTVVDYTVACQAAVGTGLDSLDGLLRGFVDIPADLAIVGSTQPVDTDCDCLVDELEQGSWIGELSFDDGPVALPAPDQEFTGIRERW